MSPAWAASMRLHWPQYQTALKQRGAVQSIA
jgi:hypothetical protein